MILRDFKNNDAQIIAGWLRSEEELYKWSADRFNKFPLSGDDINENYVPRLETGRFIPLTAADDNGDALDAVTKQSIQTLYCYAILA